MSKERQRVNQQNARAKSLGAPATLTEEEWKQIIADFKGQCAYCRNAPFEVMEHFLPIEAAGTTSQNCIPACKFCNQIKCDAVGVDLVKRFDRATIMHIQEYLQCGDFSNLSRPQEIVPYDGQGIPDMQERIYFAVSEEHATRLRRQGKKTEMMQDPSSN